jgi:cell division protein FtsW
VPLTGITLPFVSYGGSSILASFIMIGLLLSISHRSSVGADAESAS